MGVVDLNERAPDRGAHGEGGFLPFGVAYLEEPGVIETVYTGILSTAEFNEAVAATADAAAEHLCTRFLSDCTGLEAGDQSATLEIWARAVALAWLAA